MRQPSTTTVAAKNLFDLKATTKDIEMIDQIMADLAAGTKAGIPLPLQSSLLGAKRKLYQYQAGRYKLNYTISKTEVVLVSVMI
jgi:hypothetical protein